VWTHPPEWGNAISAWFLVMVGAIGLFFTFETHIAYRLMYVCMFINGITSSMNHATLQMGWAFLDEFSMFLGINLAAWFAADVILFRHFVINTEPAKTMTYLCLSNIWALIFVSIALVSITLDSIFYAGDKAAVSICFGLSAALFIFLLFVAWQRYSREREILLFQACDMTAAADYDNFGRIRKESLHRRMTSTEVRRMSTKLIDKESGSMRRRISIDSGPKYTLPVYTILWPCGRFKYDKVLVTHANGKRKKLRVNPRSRPMRLVRRFDRIYTHVFWGFAFFVTSAVVWLGTEAVLCGDNSGSGKQIAKYTFSHVFWHIGAAYGLHCIGQFFLFINGYNKGRNPHFFMQHAHLSGTSHFAWWFFRLIPIVRIRDNHYEFYTGDQDELSQMDLGYSSPIEDWLGGISSEHYEALTMLADSGLTCFQINDLSGVPGVKHEKKLATAPGPRGPAGASGGSSTSASSEIVKQDTTFMETTFSMQMERKTKGKPKLSKTAVGEKSPGVEEGGSDDDDSSSSSSSLCEGNNLGFMELFRPPIKRKRIIKLKMEGGDRAQGGRPKRLSVTVSKDGEHHHRSIAAELEKERRESHALKEAGAIHEDFEMYDEEDADYDSEDGQDLADVVDYDDDGARVDSDAAAEKSDSIELVVQSDPAADEF
jgi:hypothetical protein